MPNAPYAGDCLDQAGTDPWKVMRIVRGDLAAREFETQTLARDDSQFLAIMSPAWRRCELSIEEDGTVCWECKLATGHETDPGLLSRLILHMLAPNDSGNDDPELTTPPGTTLKGAVGRTLDARGLDVRLVVYQDTVYYEAEVQIAVANLERPERGQVRLSDDADVVWEWSCRNALVKSAEDAAKTIVAVLAKAAELAKLR